MLLNLLGQNAHFIGRARYFLWTRHHILTLRLGLVLLCLVLTLLGALLTQTGSDILVIIPALLVVGIGGFLLIYYNIQLTLLILLVVSTVLSTGIGTGTGTPITFTLVLLIILPVIWLLKILVERASGARPLPASLPALLFIATVIIATLWSGTYADADVRFLYVDKINVRMVTALTIIVSVLAYFLFANHMRSLSAMKFFVGWFIGIGALFAYFKLVGDGVPIPLNEGGQLPAWIIIMALGQTLFNDEMPRLLRLTLLGVVGAWVYITFFLGVTWLSGWLPGALGVLVLVGLRSRKLFVVCLVVVVAVALVKTDVISRTAGAENAESGVTRTEAWSRVIDLTQGHLLFGTGPVGYHFYFTVRIGGRYQLSHNNYVDILAQTGIVGSIFFIWMWLAIGWTVWRMYRTLPRHGFRYALGASLVAAYPITIATMMLGDWVTPFPYTNTLAGIDYTIWHWMMAGMAGALYALNTHSQPSQLPFTASPTYVAPQS